MDDNKVKLIARVVTCIIVLIFYVLPRVLIVISVALNMIDLMSMRRLLLLSLIWARFIGLSSGCIVMEYNNRYDGIYQRVVEREAGAPGPG